MHCTFPSGSVYLFPNILHGSNEHFYIYIVLLKYFENYTIHTLRQIIFILCCTKMQNYLHFFHDIQLQYIILYLT